MEASALTPGNSCMLLGTAHLTSLSQQRSKTSRHTSSGGYGGGVAEMAERQAAVTFVTPPRGWGKDLMGVNDTYDR